MANAKLDDNHLTIFCDAPESNSCSLQHRRGKKFAISVRLSNSYRFYVYDAMHRLATIEFLFWERMNLNIHVPSFFDIFYSIETTTTTGHLPLI
jgi:hypothetical protein